MWIGCSTPGFVVTAAVAAFGATARVDSRLPASLGLASAKGSSLPGMATAWFIGQHGSWNRKPHSGYQVVFVPFQNGKPVGTQPVEVLTGFLGSQGEAFGRPVGLAIDQHGGLLVADDVGNTVWRVSKSN